MAALTTIILGAAAVAGAGAAAAGYDQQRRAAKKQDRAFAEQRSANLRAQEASAKAEALRERQMKLDAMRQRRQAFREAQIARATASSRAGGAGLSLMGGLTSSATDGGQAQITTNSNNQLGAINQNLAIGEGIFAANAEAGFYSSQASDFGSQANAAQRGIDQGKSLTALGTSIFQSAGTLSNVGASLFKPSAGAAGVTGGWNTYTERS